MKMRTIHHFVRMYNPNECNDPDKCCYYLDGKSHKGIPVVVLIGLEHIYGGEQRIKDNGYKKHWMFFEHPVTHEYTFGNKFGFEETGDEEERALAKTFERVPGGITCYLDAKRN